MKTLKLKFQLILLACLFLGYSCDKTTTKIPIALLEIELDDITVGSTTKKGTKDDALNYFSAVQNISLDSLKGIENALKYKSKIESIEIGSASITITTTDSTGGTVVKDFVLQTNHNDVGQFSIDQYNLGTPYTNNVQDFANNFLFKLFFVNNIEVTTSGRTDVPSGENLKVKITLKDITLIANILK